MFFWISEVPPPMVSRRYHSAALGQRPPSTVWAEPCVSWAYGPSNSVANMASRTLSSEPASLLTDPSGPGGAPLRRLLKLRNML